MAFNPDCFNDSSMWCTSECLELILAKHYMVQSDFDKMAVPGLLFKKSRAKIETLLLNKNCSENVSIGENDDNGNPANFPASAENTKYSVALFKALLTRNPSDFEFYKIKPTYPNVRQAGGVALKLKIGNMDECYNLSVAYP